MRFALAADLYCEQSLEAMRHAFRASKFARRNYVETPSGTARGSVSGAVGGPAGGASRGAPTARNFTEANLKAVLQSIWNSGGKPDTIMLGGFNKQVVDATSRSWMRSA